MPDVYGNRSDKERQSVDIIAKRILAEDTVIIPKCIMNPPSEVVVLVRDGHVTREGRKRNIKKPDDAVPSRNKY